MIGKFLAGVVAVTAIVLASGRLQRQNAELIAYAARLEAWRIKQTLAEGRYLDGRTDVLEFIPMPQFREGKP